MKKLIFSLVLAVLATFSLSAHNGSDLKAGFSEGNPEIKSINAMAFGPEGILFIGDSKNAKIIAVDTKDNASAEAPKQLNFKQVDEHIAAMMGTDVESIKIQDMAINPVSKMIYLAVHLQDGTPALLKTDGKEFKNVALSPVSFAEISLEKAIAADAKDRRGRSMRQWAISDLAYHDGKVMVSGLSSEEFSSTFRSIPFPFENDQTYASLEIYHAAHGRYETYAPIKTFMPFNLNGKDHLVASYTCTPLVITPLEGLNGGQHVKARTVAELGNRNTPLDIISYKKGDKTFLLLANTSRSLMKIDPSKIETFDGTLTEKVPGSSTDGVEFISLPYVYVQQMDKFSDDKVVFLQRKNNGSLDLFLANTNRL